MRLTALVLGLLTIGCVNNSLQAQDQTSECNPHAHPAMLERSLTVYTEPRRTLAVAAEFSGRITAIAADVGQPVPAGRATIDLDDTLAALTVEQADSAIKAATAMRNARAAGLALQQSEAAYAEREFERVRNLADNGRAAEQVRDARAQDLQRAQLAADNESQLLIAAEADLAAAIIRQREAIERLHRHHITAPAGWIITKRLREIGAMVNPGEPILEVADVGTLLLTCRLDAGEIDALRTQAKRQTLTVTFPGKPETVPAHILRVDVTYDIQSRKRLVELVIPGASAPEASGGLAAELRLHVADPTGGLEIPNAYVTWRFERAILTDKQGVEHVVVPLRRHATGIIISSDALAADTILTAVTP